MPTLLVDFCKLFISKHCRRLSTWLKCKVNIQWTQVVGKVQTRAVLFDYAVADQYTYWSSVTAMTTSTGSHSWTRCDLRIKINSCSTFSRTFRFGWQCLLSKRFANNSNLQMMEDSHSFQQHQINTLISISSKLD